MRKTEKEITDINEKLAVLKKCKVCRLALSENNRPYVVPLNYGFDFKDNVLSLYFHGAPEGKKIDIIKKNNLACFEVDCDTQLMESENPCNFNYAFKSIIGTGKIFFLEAENEKSEGLNRIMQHQTDKESDYNFTGKMMGNLVVYKMIIEEFSGKQKVIPL